MLVIGAYLSYRITVLVMLEEYQILHSTQEAHFDDLKGFAHDDGFKVAAGVINYDGSEVPIEDPEIGTLKFYIKHFTNADFEGNLGFHVLESDYCDPAKDFNDAEGSRPESGFYPPDPASNSDLTRLGNLLKCVREPYTLLGNFDTSVGGNLMAIFEKCDRTERTCKSEEEIEAWMSWKYIYTLENRRRFVSYKFGAETIEESSFGSYYSLSYKARSDFPTIIKRSALKLNDSVFSIGNLFSKEVTGFDLEKMPQRLLPYQKIYQNAVTYEVSMVREYY